jgi:excisionase family DNA binding protein
MSEIMTTKEMAAYLKLHEITICKYAAEGVIPAVRIGRVWRFDKDEIDIWIAEGPQLKAKETKKTKIRSRKPRNK